MGRTVHALGQKVARRLALTLALAAGTPSMADADASAKTGEALSEADGSVRAEGGLRLAISHTPNPAGDYAVAIGQRVQPQMARVRRCYQGAAHRDARLDGEVAIRLSNVRKGGRKVTLARNETGDRSFERCLLRALAKVRLRGLPTNAAALVEVRISAPGAEQQRELAQRAAKAQRVRVRRNRRGDVESAGSTQGGEVRFALQASERQQASLVALHQEVSARLAGLLDCRRRATRHGKTPQGALVFDVRTEAGKIGRVRTVDNQTRDARASTCVEDWLQRGEHRSLPSGQVRLTLHYGP